MKIAVLGYGTVGSGVVELMHMNPEQTVYQFFLGSACSYIVICTGNILCSIIVHSVSNLLAFLLMLAPTQEGSSYALPYPVVMVILTIVLMVVGVITITLLGKKLIGKKEKKEPMLSKRENKKFTVDTLIRDFEASDFSWFPELLSVI